MRHLIPIAALCLIPMLVVGVAVTQVTNAPSAPGIRFEEIAGKAGLRFTLRNGASGGFHQIELMGGGVAAFDYNNDGCTDIFFTNGSAIPSLKKDSPEYRNRLSQLPIRHICERSAGAASPATVVARRFP